ncbi:MAG TPA: ATPase, T2SS/T4P/T4SS family [Candidatus Cloacimonadota bacterium]|nr:ATPase, T2SS/T4P/T4SS family [Candidatus Cloacimonadota bacterium]
MALSFYSALCFHIPENYLGVEQCEIIEQWLKDHPENESECHDLLKTWLLKTRELNASDIDFGAPGCEKQVWMRVYGIKKPYPIMGKFEYVESAAIILSWLSPSQKQRLYKHRSVDFSLSFETNEINARFRGSAYFDRGYLAVNFRRINDKLYTMDNLGIPQIIKERMNVKHLKAGLVLVTGITGSGKSTTLDTIIDMNNRENAAHIVIIGHPIEYVHSSQMSLVRHREVGVDVVSFEHGAIEALRQDPDIIVVGEMRDPQTIATVLEITDSGHKAFTTLHTSSAIESIHRIVAEFPPEEQERIRNRLADVLSVTMSQKLVPTIDGRLVMAKEILSVDASVQAAIRNSNIGEIYQMMVEGKRLGMCTLEQDLRELQKKGIITQQTAMNYANNKKRMSQLITMA